LIKVDVRENNGPIPSLLRSMNVNFDTVVLEVGDYVVGDAVCIERKEVGDYLNSLFDGRLHTQLYEMSKNYEVSVLIVEGNLLKEAWKRRMVNPKLYASSLAGAMWKVAPVGKQGRISVLSLPDEVHTAHFIVSMSEKVAGDGIRLPEVHKEKADDNEWALRVVSMLPGVGREKAKRLLIRFGSIENLVKADIDELMEVEGIGHVTATKIKNVFSTNFLGGLVNEINREIQT
jgi:ERCC4-type nuclease